MKNASAAIKRAYYTALTNLGYVAYDGMAPDTAQRPYVILSSRTMSQLPDKTGFMSECTILLDIVTDGNFGYKRSEEIAGTITEAINGDTYTTALTTDDFQLCSCELIGNDNIPGINPFTQIFRTLLRYKHLAKQL